MSTAEPTITTEIATFIGRLASDSYTRGRTGVGYVVAGPDALVYRVAAGASAPWPGDADSKTFDIRTATGPVVVEVSLIHHVDPTGRPLWWTPLGKDAALPVLAACEVIEASDIVPCSAT